MALTYDQISAITEKKFIPKMVDNIFNTNALLKKLKAKEKPQSGGDKVICPLEYAQASASGWYQGAETVDTTDSEVITARLWPLAAWAALNNRVKSVEAEIANTEVNLRIKELRSP